MKILFADIETRPTLAWVWGIWRQNVGINQIESPGEMFCFAAKWRGQKRVIYDGVNKSSKEDMVKHIHELLDDCDVFVHYNGNAFDRKEINKMFLLHGLNPPSPYKQVDLLAVIRKQFRFQSNKLQFIADQLGIGKKLPHEGFELWKKCMEGNKRAWATMRAYNIQDVHLTEELYDRLLPWITNHPIHGAHGDNGHVCPKCGSKDVQRRGIARTTVASYQRWQCQSCGGWSRGTANQTSTERNRDTLRNHG